MWRILPLVLLLAGCSTLPTLNVHSTVGMNALLAAESAYGSALAAENVYKSLPLCKKDGSVPPPCAKRSIIVRLQGADRQVLFAVRAAVKFTETYPTVDASNVIGAVNTALNNLSAILAGAN
jgi:hypothetical protein